MKKNNVYSLLLAFLSAFTLEAQTVSLTIPDMTVDPGETFNVDVQAADFYNIAGMQFALTWNPDIIEFQSVGGFQNLPDLTVENFNAMFAADGKMRMLWSWIDPNTNIGVTLADNSTLFSITFKAVGGQGTNTLVEITSDTMNPILPIEISTTNEVLDVVIDNGKITISGTNASFETQTSDFILFQNNPNPFTELTYISFNLNEGSDARLTVYDHSGKTVFQQHQKYPAGLSRIPVRRDMFQSAGSYFYTLETERASATRQLVAQ
ncbi:MAG: T9SS type A sorting domain-containing protein [Bacteroidetes bacterium]|nr:T9SS type A sorting domain-containing protein [Bacteroidota bacterium]